MYTKISILGKCYIIANLRAQSEKWIDAPGAPA